MASRTRSVFGSIRRAFEAIVYAGMKPSTPSAPPPPVQKKGWLGSMGAKINRVLSGPAPTDPLYLSNRTVWQKLRLIVVVWVPCLMLAYATNYALHLRRKPPNTLRDPSASERNARVPVARVSSNQDVDVPEVRAMGGFVTGTVKNNTRRLIPVAEVSFDLADSGGHGLGAVSTRVTNLAAESTARFRFPIAQRTAAIALVREAHEIRAD